MMRLAEACFDTPLMIDERKAATIATVFGPRFLGGDVIVVGAGLTDHSVYRDERMALVGDPLRRSLEGRGTGGFPIIDGVGIIAVEGTLVRKGAWLGQSSGQTSYEGISAQVARAMAFASSGALKGVVYEVDSFGGMVNGAFAAAERMHALSAKIPTLAILTDYALSAGYLMASTARQIVMPKHGAAGSIGVIYVHVDRSGEMEKKGHRLTIVKSGAYKTDGAGSGPPSAEFVASQQASVDMARDELAETIGRFRGGRLTKAMALATEARVYEGEAAVKAGLVDGIGDPHDAFAAFVAAVNRG